MITEEQMRLTLSLIITGYKPEKIILFGSYASGKQTTHSDIDLLVIKDEKLPKVKRNRAARSFVKDSIVPIDIIVKTPEEFEKYKNIIGSVVYSANKYGKVVYEA